MDKSWLKSPKDSVEYREGVTRFILSSKKFARNPEMVICPCKVCRNLKPQTDDDLFIHLNKYGVDNEYTVWLAHGEQVSASTEVEDCDSYNIEDEYRKKVNEAEVPLYPGCTKYTKISATLDMYKLKATFGLSNAAFDEFLKQFKDMLPDANSFPESLYTIKKFLKEFDLGQWSLAAFVTLLQQIYDMAETSKIGTKRGRKDSNDHARDSDECSKTTPQNEPNSGSTDNGKKKTRGKTTLQVIPTGEKNRQSLEWNERGQPVGEVSKKFSSTVGVIVRESIPIN
ncbi:hypothetical protein M0R45_008703 [Rubus argutus]|uniref:Transposase-associated domain-containing protein n=1 Tax=Rubus argutus TaxID=59490 RepID=A0AAW1Y5T9_RUBAR